MKEKGGGVISVLYLYAYIYSYIFIIFFPYY